MCPLLQLLYYKVSSLVQCNDDQDSMFVDQHSVSPWIMVLFEVVGVGKQAHIQNKSQFQSRRIALFPKWKGFNVFNLPLCDYLVFLMDGTILSLQCCSLLLAIWTFSSIGSYISLGQKELLLFALLYSLHPCHYIYAQLCQYLGGQ